MGAIGGYNKEIAQHIYRENRKEVDRQVSSGSLPSEDADRTWACNVADDLTKAGAPVPKNISEKCKGK